MPDSFVVENFVVENNKSLRALDYRFGQWVARNFAVALDKQDGEKLQRIAQVASYAVYLKHSCVDFSVYKKLADPVLNKLLDDITATDITRLVNKNITPLVASVDGSRVWLQKYYVFEKSVAEQLQALQQQQRLEIITGGPGTGKTYTAAKRIQQELQTHPGSVIALAAPTGKAANNMMLALGKSGFVTEHTNLKGLTIHALLGMNGRSPQPRRNKNNPLSCDLLIVDEASMIDLPMMHRLLQALPPHASLLLLGDKDQLASVEAGSVLGDMCAVFANECVLTLGESHRYKASPEIGKLAEALNAGTVPDMSNNTKVLHHILSVEKPWEPAWLDIAIKFYSSLQEKINNGASIEVMLESRAAFQILCALREGPQGVNGINFILEKALGKKTGSWYAGRPVMITQNDHDRKLYNGDVGMVLPIDGVLRACFMVDGAVKTISQAQMPAYETCYAITIHKSQGSEYGHVLIVLPTDAQIAINNPVLTRELVYTAVTRAKSQIDLWSGEGVLEAAAQKITQRMSGLKFFSAGH